MSSEPHIELFYLNHLRNKVLPLKGKDFTDQLDKLKRAIEYMLQKMQKLGDYELSEFTATAGVELGVWVFKTNGSIMMKWTKST